jgi:hypothetical protein
LDKETPLEDDGTAWSSVSSSLPRPAVFDEEGFLFARRWARCLANQAHRNKERKPSRQEDDEEEGEEDEAAGAGEGMAACSPGRAMNAALGPAAMVGVKVAVATGLVA